MRHPAISDVDREIDEGIRGDNDRRLLFGGRAKDRPRRQVQTRKGVRREEGVAIEDGHNLRIGEAAARPYLALPR